MTEEIAALIEKSQRALRAAERLYESDDYDFAVSRAYYAMFYAAEAALLSQNKAASKHSAIIALFYEYFVKTEIFPRVHHQNLHHAFELRQQGDYWAESEITAEMAQALLEKAEKFIAEISKYLLR